MKHRAASLRQQSYLYECGAVYKSCDLLLRHTDWLLTNGTGTRHTYSSSVFERHKRT